MFPYKMSLTFKNQAQADELISHLQIGQIIKVEVLEKINHSQFLISYQNITLIASSSLDLLSKTVWLKVLQKKPYPQLQLIIEENHNSYCNLLAFVQQEQLILPELIPSVVQFLKTLEHQIPPLEIYQFVLWYLEELSYGIIEEETATALQTIPISLKEIIVALDSFFQSQNIHLLNPRLSINNKENELKILLSTKELLDIFKDHSFIDSLLQKQEIIQRINQYWLDVKQNFFLGFIKYSWCFVVFPLLIEQVTNGMVFKNVFRTKHFGTIAIHYQNLQDKSEINLLFENLLYLQTVKKYLIKQNYIKFFNLLEPVNKFYQKRNNMIHPYLSFSRRFTPTNENITITEEHEFNVISSLIGVILSKDKELE